MLCQLIRQAHSPLLAPGWLSHTATPGTWWLVDCHKHKHLAPSGLSHINSCRLSHTASPGTGSARPCPRGSCYPTATPSPPPSVTLLQNRPSFYIFTVPPICFTIQLCFGVLPPIHVCWSFHQNCLLNLPYTKTVGTHNHQNFIRTFLPCQNKHQQTSISSYSITPSQTTSSYWEIKTYMYQPTS